MLSRVGSWHGECRLGEASGVEWSQGEAILDDCTVGGSSRGEWIRSEWGRVECSRVEEGEGEGNVLWCLARRRWGCRLRDGAV